jgi:hypothetical protein
MDKKKPVPKKPVAKKPKAQKGKGINAQTQGPQKSNASTQTPRNASTQTDEIPTSNATTQTKKSSNNAKPQAKPQNAKPQNTKPQAPKPNPRVPIAQSSKAAQARAPAETQTKTKFDDVCAIVFPEYSKNAKLDFSNPRQMTNAHSKTNLMKVCKELNERYKGNTTKIKQGIEEHKQRLCVSIWTDFFKSVIRMARRGSIIFDVIGFNSQNQQLKTNYFIRHKYVTDPDDDNQFEIDDLPFITINGKASDKMRDAPNNLSKKLVDDIVKKYYENQKTIKFQVVHEPTDFSVLDYEEIFDGETYLQDMNEVDFLTVDNQARDLFRKLKAFEPQVSYMYEDRESHSSFTV